MHRLGNARRELGSFPQMHCSFRAWPSEDDLTFHRLSLINSRRFLVQNHFENATRLVLVYIAVPTS